MAFAQPCTDVVQPLLKLCIESPVLALVVIFLAQCAVQLFTKKSTASAEDANGKNPPRQANTLPCGKSLPGIVARGSAASAAWDGQHGRFKFRGLRPDPLDASHGPPEYSLKPLDLKLPELSASEAAALAKLTERVSDMTSKHRTDPGTLVRYLKARKFNVDQTEKYFREAARWRLNNGVYEALTHWNLKAYEECLAPWWLSGGFFGHGKNGEMIAYERIAHSDWAGLVRRMPWQELVKLDIVHCMRSLAACEEDCLRRGVPMGNGILIQDCHGYGFDQASLAAARALNKLIENRNFLMPECLTKILVVRAPSAWVYAWKMFSSILDPGIREKVEVAGNREGESISLLRRFINDDEIPAYLGGSKYIEGDPECSKVLAPGGRMPEEALQRFLKLAAEGPSAEKGDEIRHQPSRPWAPCVQREVAEEYGEEGKGKGNRSCCG